jgi:hypothetical protein
LLVRRLLKGLQALGMAATMISSASGILALLDEPEPELQVRYAAQGERGGRGGEADGWAGPLRMSTGGKEGSLVRCGGGEMGRCF